MIKVHYKNRPIYYQQYNIVRATQFFAENLMPRLHSKCSVLIDFTVNHKSDLGDCTWTDDPARPREFEIHLNPRIGAIRLLETLAHECVHMKQFASGELRDLLGSSEVAWKRKLYPGYYTNPGDYLNLPWEIEAYGKEKGLAVLYRQRYKLNTRQI